VPLLEAAPDIYITESNAMLWYLAGGSVLAAGDRIARRLGVMDILRAAQPRAHYRRRLFLAGLQARVTAISGVRQARSACMAALPLKKMAPEIPGSFSIKAL
jgi:hypothetical protein